jgi:hypothetical protein
MDGNTCGKARRFKLGALIALAASPSALATELRIHGFADLVASKGDSDYPINSIHNRGKRLNLDSESDLGLNLSADLGENLTFAGQVVGRGDAGGKYQLAADWLFATYRPVDSIAVRAGRQINPLYLYSEQIDVGFLLPWVRLPYEVYGLNPIKAFSGISVIHSWLTGDLQLRTQLFAGGGSFDLDSGQGTSYSGNLSDSKGLDVTLTGDHFKFRAGYSAATPDITVATRVPLAPGSPVTGTYSFPANIGAVQTLSAGATFDCGDFVGMSEAVRQIADGTLIRSALGAYGTLGYRLRPDLTSYLTYSWRGNLDGLAYAFPDATVSSTVEKDQHSWILGINFKASASVAVKAEYMRTVNAYVDSTRDFDADVASASVDLVF